MGLFYTAREPTRSLRSVLLRAWAYSTTGRPACALTKRCSSVGPARAAVDRSMRVAGRRTRHGWTGHRPATQPPPATITTARRGPGRPGAGEGRADCDTDPTALHCCLPTSVRSAVPPRPQDGTACFSHRTLHHMSQRRNTSGRL